jgi:hypothetical protein
VPSIGSQVSTGSYTGKMKRVEEHYLELGMYVRIGSTEGRVLDASSNLFRYEVKTILVGLEGLLRQDGEQPVD